jgi:transcriptional regulator with XRE-family HTH domain
MLQGAVMVGGFGQKLKEIRARAGLTQEALARAADISLSAVTKLESGKVDPTWGTVQRIAKALGVSVEAFKDEESPELEPTRPAPKKGRK